MNNWTLFIVLILFFFYIAGCKCTSINAYKEENSEIHSYKLPKDIEHKICDIKNAQPFEVVVLHEHSSHLQDINLHWKTVDLRKLIQNNERLSVYADTVYKMSDKDLKELWKQMLVPFIVKDYPGMPKRPNYIEYRVSQEVNDNNATVVLNSITIFKLEMYPEGWKITDIKSMKK